MDEVRVQSDEAIALTISTPSDCAQRDAFGAQFESSRHRMERALGGRLPHADKVPSRLYCAMRYSDLSGSWQQPARLSSARETDPSCDHRHRILAGMRAPSAQPSSRCPCSTGQSCRTIAPLGNLAPCAPLLTFDRLFEDARKDAFSVLARSLRF
jgi:hypothetical protein